MDEVLARTLLQDAQTNAPFLLANDMPSGSPYALPVGTVSDDGVAIVGHDGWLYVTGGTNHWYDQFVGLRNLSSSQVAQWRRLVGGRQRFLAGKGIRYAHITIPDKQCVHPQKFPSPPQPGLRPILQLADVPALLYPLNDLLPYAEYMPLWLRGNSHWNVYGCYLIARTLLTSLGFPIPAWRQVITETISGGQDLTGKYSPAWREPIRVVRTPAYEVFNNRLWQSERKHVGNHYILDNPNATHPDTICIFGDSYSWDGGLSHMLSYVFRQVHFVWNTNINLEYCHAAKATVVITETAERNMVHVPDENNE